MIIYLFIVAGLTSVQQIRYSNLIFHGRTLNYRTQRILVDNNSVSMEEHIEVNENIPYLVIIQ